VDFEWLVVDDGSADDTRALVERWQGEASFPIRYRYQDNRGKHVAINHAVRLAAAPYLVILDSDDSCLPGALAELLAAWSGLPPEWGVVTFLCQDQGGRLVGTPFPAATFDSTYYEMVVVHGMRGDKWECYRTAVLREFPFPEELRESAVPEGIILGRIGTRYLTRYVNRPLRIYHDDGADSSIVRSSDPRRNPIGRLWAQRENLTVPRFLFWNRPQAFVTFGVKHARMCGLARVSLGEALGHLPWRLSRLIAVLTWPAGRFIAAAEVLLKRNASGAADRISVPRRKETS